MYNIEQVKNPLTRLDPQAIEEFLTEAFTLRLEYLQKQQQMAKERLVTAYQSGGVWTEHVREPTSKEIEEQENNQMQITKITHILHTHILSSFCQTLVLECPKLGEELQQWDIKYSTFYKQNLYKNKAGQNFLNFFKISTYEHFFMFHYLNGNDLYTTLTWLGKHSLTPKNILDKLIECYPLLGFHSSLEFQQQCVNNAFKILESHIKYSSSKRADDITQIMSFIFSIISFEQYLEHYYPTCNKNMHQEIQRYALKMNLLHGQEHVLQQIPQADQQFLQFFATDVDLISLQKYAEKQCNAQLIKKWTGAVSTLNWQDGSTVEPNIITYLLEMLTKIQIHRHLSYFKKFYTLLHPQSQYQLDHDLIHYFFAKKHSNQENTLALLQLGHRASALFKEIQPFLQKNKTKYERIYHILDAILDTEKSESLQFIFETARSFPKTSVREYAERCIDRLATRRQCEICEIADQAIPNLDFDLDHQQIISYGEGQRQFRIQLQPDLSIKIFNEEDKVLKSLPEANRLESSDEAKQQKKAFTQLKKSLTYTVKFQQNALFDAMCIARQWSVADWQQYFLNHPIMGFLIQSIFYIEHCPDGNSRIFRVDDFSLIDLNNDEIELYPNSKIQIAHATLIDKVTIKKCVEHINHYKIKPFLSQFSHLIYDDIDIQNLNIHLAFDFINGIMEKYGFKPESTHIGNSELNFFYRGLNYNQLQVKFKTLPYSPYEIMNFADRKNTLVKLQQLEFYRHQWRDKNEKIELHNVAKPLLAEMQFICTILKQSSRSPNIH